MNQQKDLAQHQGQLKMLQYKPVVLLSGNTEQLLPKLILSTPPL